MKLSLISSLLCLLLSLMTVSALALFLLLFRTLAGMS